MAPKGNQGGPRHPETAALAAFACGTLDRTGRAAVTRHLLAGCVRCKERLAPLVRATLAAGPEALPRARGPAPEYDLPLRRMLRVARRHQAARRRAAEEAATFLLTAELPGALPDPEVRRSHASAWLEAARALRRGEPARHEQAALYAASLAEGLLVADGRDRAARMDDDRAAAAWGEVGNARRRLGQLASAEQAFRTAMGHAGRGTGDRLLHATLLDLSASLSIAQRSFDRAGESLALAGLLYERAGQETRVAKTLVQRGLVAGYAGKPEAAVSLFCRALDRIDCGREPVLFRTAVLNTVYVLVDLHDLPRAEGLFADARPLLEEIGGPLDRLKVRWIEAKIAGAAGRCHQAERTFRDLRRAYAGERMPYYVALVSLELCAIWLREGRAGELRAAVSEALATFLALGIEREALASVILLEEAAQQERATLDLVARALREAEGLEGRGMAGRAGAAPAA